MTVTIASFRADYPEFADVTLYPDAAITFWLNVSILLFNVDRWYDLLDLGTEMFIAHNLVLEVQAQAQSKNGAPPGTITGVTSAKSVDKVSISYDVASGVEKEAGHWNLTTYGTRLIKLIKMVGAGPVQLGVGAAPYLSGGAWSGPNVTPGFTNFGN